MKPRNYIPIRIVICCYIALFMLGCDKKTDCCVNFDIAVDIVYMSGNLNIFDPDDGLYTESDITVEHLKGTSWVEVSRSTTKGYFLFENESIDANVLRVFPDAGGAHSKQSIRVTVGDLPSDIIEVEISKSGASTIVTKVWHNDDLKWEISDSASNEFGDQRMFFIKHLPSTAALSPL